MNRLFTINLIVFCSSDILSGGKLHIQTMDKFALLLGIPEDRTPSALLEMTSSDLSASAKTSSEQSATAMMSPVGPEEWVTAIHVVNNRYVVSSQYETIKRDYIIAIFDSVRDDEREQHLLPQLRCLYERVRHASDIRYRVPKCKGSTSASGLFAAAHATMRMHRKDPDDYILDEDLLRCHMYRCLQNEKVTLFPALTQSDNEETCRD